MEKLEILTRCRTHDWIAWIEKYEGIWEAGKTEAEAVGKLVLSVQNAWKDTFQVAAISAQNQ